MIPALFFRPALTFAVSHGGKPHELDAILGLALGNPPGQMLSFDQVDLLWSWVRRAAPEGRINEFVFDIAIGMPVGQTSIAPIVSPRLLGSSLADVVESFFSSEVVIDNEIVWRRIDQGTTQRVEFELPASMEWHAQVSDYIVATTWLKLVAARGEWSRACVAIAFAGACYDLERVRRWIGVDTELQPGCARPAIIFDTQEFDRPFGSHSSPISALVKSGFDQSVYGDSKRQAKAVEEIIVAVNEGCASMKAFAARKGASVRSVQRHLKSLGIEGASLIREQRMLRAEKLITGTDYPLREISEMVGYSDERSFQRAFKKWAGRSPFQVRKTALRGFGAVESAD